MVNPRIEVDTLYDILKLPKTATKAEIKKRYLKLSLKFHEDKIKYAGRKVTPEDTLRFQDVGMAYEVLSDGDGKFLHDLWIKPGSTEKFSCPNCPKQINRAGGAVRSKASLRLFCSGACAKTWNEANGYAPNTFRYNEEGDLEGGTPPPPPP